MAFASDTFTDTAGINLTAHTPTSGGSWTKVGAGTDVVIYTDGVGAQNSGANEWAPYYHSAAPASADYEVQCDVLMDAAGAEVIGPAGRIDSVDQTGYFVRFQGGTWELYACVVSVEGAAIGTYTGDGWVSGVTTRVCKLKMTGTTIEVFIDGVSRISVTNSAIAGPGKAGTGSYYSGGGTNRYIKNWSASDPATGGAALMGQACL